jgi:hypothetical protein
MFPLPQNNDADPSAAFVGWAYTRPDGGQTHKLKRNPLAKCLKQGP